MEEDERTLHQKGEVTQRAAAASTANRPPAHPDQSAKSPRQPPSKGDSTITTKAPQSSTSSSSTSRRDKNTSVYITGLPTTTTPESLAAIFRKCGIIMQDLVTNEPRIKVYKDADGLPKGDGLVTYLAVESVQLAIDILDETEFMGSEIRVQQAEFHGNASKNRNDAQDKKQEPKRQEERPRLSKAALEKRKRRLMIQKRKLDWDEDDADTRKGRENKHGKVAVLKHMFTLQELEQDVSLMLDLKQDIWQECASFGKVLNVTLYDQEPDGVVLVKFTATEDAERCVGALNGRYFAGRTVEASIFDGQKYKKRVEKGDEEEEKKRIEEFARWLEQAQEDEEEVPEREECRKKVKAG